MPAINEVTVTNYNALHPFDLDGDWGSSLDAIKTFDSDVLVMPETSMRYPELRESGQLMGDEHWDKLQAEMAVLGYKGVAASSREDLVTTTWSRLATPEAKLSVIPLGEVEEATIAQLAVDDFGTLFADHATSHDRKRRAAMARAIVQHAGTVAVAGEGLAVIGDLNAAYARDSVTTRILRGLDPFARRVPGFSDADDYFNSSPAKQAAGKIVRATAMTNDGSLKVYERAGFRDAAGANRQATVHIGPLAMRTDHVFVQGFDVTSYDVLERPQDKNG